jgi:hypothetical protein
MARTKTYRAWVNMKSRCTNPSTRDYSKYGGRGIAICHRWNVFDNFLADLGEMPLGYSLERIDVNGHYEPKNCKWIPWKEQYNNTRQTRLITCFGRTLTMAQWARATGIKRNTIEGAY